jgi:hypothetical protein
MPPNRRFKSQNAEQSQNQRDKTVDKKELRGKTSEPELFFSFKFFDTSQIPHAQHFREWELDTPANNCLKEILKIRDGYLQKIKLEDNELHEIIFEEFIEELDKILKEYFKADSAKQGLLSDFFEKLVGLSKETRTTSKQKKMLEVYGDFPPNSVTDFKIPKFSDMPNGLEWGTLQDVGGQKVRVAGFMVSNIFYVVFLDKNHKFWKSKK